VLGVCTVGGPLRCVLELSRAEVAEPVTVVCWFCWSLFWVFVVCFRVHCLVCKF